MNTVLWTAVIAAALVVEGLTAGLTTIWFAAGAAVALGVCALGFGSAAQIGAFVVSSGIFLAATRPLVRRITRKNAERTNADACVGKIGIVTEKIDTVNSTGQVKVGGVCWSARADEDIDVGERVVVEEIRGVHVLVKKCERA